MSQETYFGRASGLDRSHRAVPDHSYAVNFSETVTAAKEAPAAQVPQIVFYEHLHFEGGSASTAFGWKYVGDWWANKVASVVVISGTWELCSERDYAGECHLLTPGYYDDIPGTIASIRARR